MAGEKLKRLLIVDDEEDLLFMVSLAAEATGKFVVETARDGEEGLAKARQFRPDVVVLDGIMPRMDGFELCRRLRADAVMKNMPVVMLSAGDPGRSEASARDAGVDRFVRKPYEQAELMRVVLAASARSQPP
jgi:two-component system phosphate regulon response regulator PhoB/two-component system alkaline phosphatase synthesis response regulator PhoP